MSDILEAKEEEEWENKTDAFLDYEDEDEDDSEFEYDSQLLEDILDGNLDALIESIQRGNSSVLENLQLIERDLKELLNLKTTNGSTPLHIASIKGKEDWVNYLVDNGSQIDAIDSEGKTALHLACIIKNSNIIQKLLFSCANVNCVDFQLRTPLHFACMIGHIDSVQMLVTQGAKIMSLDEDLLSPLHYACLNSHFYIVRYLLNPFPFSDLDDDFQDSDSTDIEPTNKADPNATDNFGRTPLHIAASVCTNGKVDIIRCLLENGGNPDSLDIYNRTPAFWCIAGSHSIECLSLLVEHNANILLKDQFGRQVLHYASFFSQIPAMQYLIDHNGDINSQDNQGRTLYHFGSHSYDVTFLLLQNSANFTIKDKDGRTALHFAAMGKYIDTFELLLTDDVDVNIADKFGRSCIHYLAANNLYETLNSLSRFTCDFNKKDARGQSPIHYAARFGGFDFIQQLKDVERPHKFMGYISSFDNKGRRPLHISASCGNPSICSFFIDNRSYSRVPDKCGATPLHYAAYFGQTSCIDILLAKGNELNTTDKFGRTPLHAAAASNSIDSVILLVKSNANLHATDNDGRTAIFYSYSESVLQYFVNLGLNHQTLDNHGRSMLHTACSLNHLSMIDYLINQESNSVDTIDNELVTPLHIAAFYGHDEAVKLLLKYNANPSFVDINIRNPLYYAASSGSLKCLEILSEKCPKNQRDILGRTALDAACFNGHVNCILFLLEKVEAANDGRTPLHSAAFNGSKDICGIIPKLLLYFDINDKDSKGLSALHRSVRRNNYLCTEVLLKNGAFVDIADNNGITPLMIASYLKYKEICELLVKYGADISIVDCKQRNASSYVELRRQKDKLENPSDDEDEDEYEDDDGDNDEDDEEVDEGENGDTDEEDDRSTEEDNDGDEEDKGEIEENDVVTHSHHHQQKIQITQNGTNSKKTATVPSYVVESNDTTEHKTTMLSQSNIDHLKELQSLKDKLQKKEEMIVELQEEHSKVLKFENEAQIKLQKVVQEMSSVEKNNVQLQEQLKSYSNYDSQILNYEKELEHLKDQLEDAKLLVENLKKENEVLKNQNKQKELESVLVNKEYLSDLKYRLFNSLTLSSKLSLPPSACVSLDSNTLYQEALRQNIPIQEWQSWIWARISK